MSNNFNTCNIKITVAGKNYHFTKWTDLWDPRNFEGIDLKANDLLPPNGGHNAENISKTVEFKNDKTHSRFSSSYSSFSWKVEP
jgi:hypothetical protein